MACTKRSGAVSWASISPIGAVAMSEIRLAQKMRRSMENLLESLKPFHGGPTNVFGGAPADPRPRRLRCFDDIGHGGFGVGGDAADVDLAKHIGILAVVALRTEKEIAI